MSHPTHAEAVTARPTLGGGADALRNLYIARSAFAIVWAGLLATRATELDPITVLLLLVYPVVDLGAAAYDLRSSRSTRQRVTLLVNLAVSLAATIGLAVAAGSAVADVLRVWGAWAIAAGLVQLVVAVQRRRGLGGQWPMIVSGGISVLAGASFIAMASRDDAALGGLAGYATLGGLFFAASAFRLHRSAAGGPR